MNINILKQYREISKDFYYRLLQTLFKQGTILLLFIISSIYLSQTEFGYYNYHLTLVYLFIIFSDFGISNATSKFIAEYDIKSKEKKKKIFFNSLIITFSSFILISFILLIIYLLGIINNINYLMLLYPLILLIPIVSLYDGIFRGNKKFKYLFYNSFWSALMSILLSFLFTSIFSLKGALISYNFYFLFSALLFYLNYKEINVKLDFILMKKIFNYSLIIGISNVGLFLYTRVDIIFLEYFNYIVEIGYYEIINKIYIFSVMPIMMLSTVIAPRITRQFYLKKYKEIKNKILFESISLFFIGIIISLFLYLLSPIIFKFIFFKYDKTLLIYLLNFFLFIIPFRFISSLISIGYITPMGYAKIISISLIFFGIINMILNYFFIIRYGFVGVIYSTIITQIMYILTTTIYFIYILKKL
jgi:O-antigen/teichoic acid export membrane protein